MKTTLPFLFLLSCSCFLVLQAQETPGPDGSVTEQVLAPGQSAAEMVATGGTATGGTATGGPRAARLAWFHGDLQIQRADNTAAADGADGLKSDSAALNMPIAEGSRLVTGDDSEAEIEFEDGSVVRLTPKTALSIDALGVDRSIAKTQLSLLGGLAYFELRHGATAAYTVAAGTMVAAPADNVVFRIAVDEPPIVVSVLSGALTVSAQTDPEGTTVGFTATVKAGESLHADPSDATRYFLDPQLAESSWDTWNQTRDNEATAQAATRTSARDGYASAQGYGWSDLDANGTWYTVTNPDGSTSQLWQPTVAANPGPDPDATESASSGDDADGFDPYGDGAFVYSGGAYLWASGFSWGWLPYRCGRWNYYPLFGWGWSPNRFCRVYGYGGLGGGGGINIGRHPHRYHIVRFPPISPVHPILRVHTAEPRPVAPHKPGATPVRIAGATAVPLQPVAPLVSPANGFVGGSLYRDYPVEAGTHRAILGSVARPVAEPVPATGWGAVTPNPAAVRSLHTPAAGSYVRPAEPARAPAPAPRPAPAAPAPAAPGKPK